MNELRRAVFAARTAFEVDDEKILTGQFRFEESFVGFDGHFPGYPLVPAVVEVFMAQMLIEEYCGHGVRLTEVAGAKFLAQLRPHTSITFVCRPLRPLPQALWEVKISTEGRPAAAFRLHLEK